MRTFVYITPSVCIEIERNKAFQANQVPALVIKVPSTAETHLPLLLGLTLKSSIFRPDPNFILNVF